MAARGLEEISDDLGVINDGRFWAVVGTFEGNWTLARFAHVTETSELPKREWKPIRSPWQSSLDRNEYGDYVEEIRRRIALGDVYQVNACRRLSVQNSDNRSLLGLMNRIVSENPAPFATYISLPELEIASASPERFLEVNDGRVLSSPIKGTSRTIEFPEKDRAENLMIVDLVRNDISAIATPGSVSTPRLLGVEEHPGLFHLVSDIEGEIRSGVSLSDLVASMMPPGSVSGAPKSSAVKLIRENERDRGPYCGALGYVWRGRVRLAVGIRTFWQSGDMNLHFGTGAGITWESDPESEWEETELKARRLIGLTQ